MINLNDSMREKIADKIRQVEKNLTDAGQEEKIGMVKLGGLTIEVKIIDRRQVWGREDVLVTPVAGEGRRWVYVDSLLGPNGKEEK